MEVRLLPRLLSNTKTSWPCSFRRTVLASTSFTHTYTHTHEKVKVAIFKPQFSCLLYGCCHATKVCCIWPVLIIWLSLQDDIVDALLVFLQQGAAAFAPLQQAQGKPTLRILLKSSLSTRRNWQLSSRRTMEAARGASLTRASFPKSSPSWRVQTTPCGTHRPVWQRSEHLTGVHQNTHFSIDDNVDWAFQNNVPWCALFSLTEHWGRGAIKPLRHSTKQIQPVNEQRKVTWSGLLNYSHTVPALVWDSKIRTPASSLFTWGSEGDTLITQGDINIRVAHAPRSWEKIYLNFNPNRSVLFDRKFNVLC